MTPITRFLTAWRETTRLLEASLIDNVAATAPWLAPLIPAFLAQRNMREVLGFSDAFAVIGGVVVEFLGLATVHTAFELWNYNRTKRKSDPPAPVRIAALMAGVYFLVIITVNVLVDPGPALHKLANALLSTLTLVAAVTLAVRAGHVRRVGEIEEEKARARKARSERAASQHKPAKSQLGAEQAGYDCETCGREFASVQALNAHQRAHASNGHVSEPINQTQESE